MRSSHSPVVRIGATVEFDTRSVTRDCLVALRYRLSHKNPATEKNRYRNREAPSVVRFYREERGRFVAPRGALSVLRAVFREHDVRPRFDSSGVVSVADASDDRDLGSFSVSLREYQRDAIRVLREKVQGVLVMPCGAGKTTTATVALLSTGESGIVIVHTRDILEQWVETIERIGGVRPRTLSDGSEPLRPGEVIVAMVQTLSKLGKHANGLLASAGVLIADECHHVPARTWESITSRCPARYRWGLTATPERSDGFGFALAYLIGPILFRVATRDLIESGFLLSPKIVPVASAWKPSEAHYPWWSRCSGCGRNTKISNPALHRSRGSSCSRCKRPISRTTRLESGSLIYGKALTALSTDSDRVELVVRLVRLAERDGRTVLVLVSRKTAVKMVVDKLVALGTSAVGVTSSTPKQNRRNLIDEIRKRRSRVIVATSLADEGLDLPAIDCVVCAAPGRSSGRAKQRVGRSLRKSGRDPIVFEIVDGGEFRSQWIQRLRGYVEEYGVESVVSTRPLRTRDAIPHLYSSRPRIVRAS